MGSKKIIRDYPNRTSLDQNATLLKYVLLDDNYKALHQPFHCKDYFNEIIATEHDGKSRKQYGFVSQKFPFNILKEKTFKMGLILATSTIKTNFYLKGLLSLLNQAEVNRGYELTIMEEDTLSDEIILISDTRWMDTPCYFSLYTLLIRLGYNYEEGISISDYMNNVFKSIDSSKKINGSEHYTYGGAEEFLIYLFEGGDILQAWKDYLNVDYNTLHNNTGLCSYFDLNYNRDLNKLKLDVEENFKSVDSLETNDIQPSSDSFLVACEEQVIACSTIPVFS